MAVVVLWGWVVKVRALDAHRADITVRVRPGGLCHATGRGAVAVVVLWMRRVVAAAVVLQVSFRLNSPIFNKCDSSNEGQ